MVSQLPEISNSEKQIYALGRFLRLLREADSNEARVEAAIDYIQEETQPTLIWIGLYDSHANNLYYVGGHAPVSEMQLLSKTLPVAPGDLLDQVFVQKRSIGIQDLSSETKSPELLDFALKFALQGCVLFPIRDSQDCRGIIMMGWQHQAVPLTSDQLNCFAIAFRELGSQLDQLLSTGDLISYRRSGSLSDLIRKLSGRSSLDEVLKTLTLETQTQIKPLETRIFWFDAHQNQFYLRGSISQGTSSRTGGTTVKIATGDMGRLYDDLRNGQHATLMVGSPTVNRLMDTLLSVPHTQCAFFTPIMAGNACLGFIVVSFKSTQPVLETTQTFLRTVAALIGLSGKRLISGDTTGAFGLTAGEPKSSGNIDIQQICLETLTEVHQGPNALKRLALTLCQLLKVKHLSVVHFDPETKSFGVVYQLTAQRRQLLPPNFGTLNALDWKLVAHGNWTFKIDNWTHDLRLLDWKPHFDELGVQALAGCRLGQAQILEGVLLVGTDVPRSWSSEDLRMLSQLSAPLGWLLREWRTRHLKDERDRLNQILLTGVKTLQTATTLAALDRMALDWLGAAFGASEASLVTWLPQQASGTLAALYPERLDAPQSVGSTLELEQVPLLSEILHYERSLSFNTQDLPTHWTKYFPAVKGRQVIAMRIQSALHQPVTGALWMGIYQPELWSSEIQSTFETAVREYAIARYRLILNTTCNTRIDSLERLNWYKLHKLDQLQKQFIGQVSWLREQAPTFEKVSEQSSNPSLVKRRYQDLLESFAEITTDIRALVQSNDWQLQATDETVLVASILKSALERIESLARSQQLWTQIQNLPEDSPVPMHRIFVKGDVEKFSLVLEHLLLAACRRSSPQGRIDIWPQLLNETWLELSITDHGVFDPELLNQLATGRLDPISPSLLDREPGRELHICQTLTRDIFGDLSYYQLEDGRIVSRLLLPVTLKS